MKHHLMVGTWTPPGAIFTFEFDDEARSLKLLKRTAIPEDEPISWMCFDHRRKAIYGAGVKKWSSYAVKSPTDIVHTSSHPMTHDPAASLTTTKTRAIFCLSSSTPPYTLHAFPFYPPHASHLTVYETDHTTGSLITPPLQHLPLSTSPPSGIHGAVLSPPGVETYLYSADLTANKIWVHARDVQTGKLSLVEGGMIEAPDPGDHPRWVEVSKCGKWLWVLMEAGNRLCEYAIDAKTHLPEYTGVSYPLIAERILNDPEEMKKKMYRADVVELSSSGKYLFATSRANDFALKGWISVYEIGREEGRIERQIFLRETSTSGGHSNAVSPCPWSDEWVAITDDEVGGIEIWKWDGERGGMERVARVDLVGEKGFGMNAIWYD